MDKKTVRFLIVESGSDYARRLAASIRVNGHAVDSLPADSSIITAIKNNDFAAAILAPGLPGPGSLEMVKKLRKDNVDIPIIAITDTQAADFCVKALDVGVDDCLTTAVGLEELLARLRAVVRRSYGHADSVLQHDRVVMEINSARVWLDEIPVRLKRREFELLHELLCCDGTVLSRNLLEQKLYSWDESLSSNSIEVHIHHLRQKLYPELIKTVRGMGYTIGKFR